MEPLDASYALLSDVSAQNRALQARLRSSLPLLWTDMALVATSVAPRRRHGRQTQHEESEADQLLSTIQGTSVSRRYKRRVEWEVARRIARVDRELQQYPPAQRFWNQRRKEAAASESLTYRQKLQKERVEREVVRDGEVAAVRKVRVKAPPDRLTRSGLTSKTTVDRSKEFWVKPEIAVKTDTVERKMKHVGTSPLAVADEDKENAKPNVPAFEASGPEKSHFQSDIISAKPQENRDVSEGEHESEKSEKPVGIAQSTRDAIRSPLEEATSDGSRHARHARHVSVEGAQQKETKAVKSTHEDSHAEDTYMDEDVSSQRVQTRTDERPSSSIGRQILSEFRTMPSVASFGARLVLSSGGLGNPGDMRLNADVLRRLFGDLDTDKDGHVNRIETCMALHRLQISVPTTKLISFFHHIHSPSDGKSVRGRNKQHLPMNEVINYKEFVAFVTAAYDQQQQQKAQRSRVAVRNTTAKEVQSKIPPLLAPSTTLPIFSQPISSPTVKRRRSPPLQLTDRDVQLYEVDDARSEGVAAYEERVLKEIPEFLVNRMLTDIPNAAIVGTKEAAVSVVRKSLESLVGKEAVDEKLVSEITQELLRERLRVVGTLNQDGTEDVTGLRKAAAYYNEQMLHGGVETNSNVDDSNSANSVNWVDVLTEEQVSGLVQQIWKDRQMSLYQAPLETAEAMSTENPAEVPESQIVEGVDESTDTNELLAAPPLLSEKGIQAFEDEREFILVQETEAAEIPEGILQDAADIPPTSLQSAHIPKTHLARALDPYLGGRNDTHDVFGKVTSINILRRLRQERRMHQSNLYEQDVPSFDAKPANSSRAIIRGEQHNTSIDLVGSESLLSSEGESRRICSEQDLRSQHEHDLPIPTPEPVLLREKMLDVDNFSSNEGSFERTKRSTSVSSSSFSSASDYQNMFGMHREIDRHQLHARPVRRRRLQRRRTFVSVSGSSVPDSICSAELSDGELSRNEAEDLSDGEIFGACKRKYFNKNNKTSNMMKSTDDDGSLLSSVESGELPALMKAHANFRHQILTQSSSSVESGEVEDGMLSG